MSDTPAGVADKTSFTQKYRRLVFGSILFSQIVSIIGSGITGFALRVWAFEFTESVTQFSLITFFYGLPGILLSPVAGALADRWDRRIIMILGDLLAGISTFTVFLLLTFDQLEVWHIYIAVAVMSVGGTFQSPAYQASIPLLVSKKNLGRANGMSQLGPALARIISPLMAGVFFVTIGLRGITQLDLATFLFAIIVLFMVRIPKPKPKSVEEQQSVGSIWREALYGWRYIRKRPGLLNLLLVFGLIEFTQGMVVVLIAPMVLSFANVSVLGVVLAISGFGALTGALSMIVWGGPKRRVRGIFGFSLLRSLLLFLGGIQPSAGLVAGASACYLFFTQITNATGQTLWQEKVELSVQGRVFAMRNLVTAIVFPLGQILAGPLADYVFEPLMSIDGAWANSIGQFIGIGDGRGIGIMLIILGLLNLIMTVGGYLHPRIRRLEDEIADAH